MYKEKPDLLPVPSERVRDASAWIRRHQAFALAPVAQHYCYIRPVRGM